MSPEHPAALFLAPHLEYPARNGADVTVVELAASLSETLGRVDVVSSRESVRYEGGTEVGRSPFRGRMRSRPVAAVRTVLKQSHYYLEKFLTPAFVAEAREHLARPDVGIVLHSYLTTASVADLSEPGRVHLVWSHNDEFEWFEDLGRSTSNPLGKAAASASLRWLGRFLTEHRDHTTLLHVTEEDQRGWERHVQSHRSAVVPIGVALRGEAAPPYAPGEPVRLLFAGALGVRMNLDALLHFAERYFPVLRDRLGDGLSVSVVGSSPLPDVAALCRQEGWALRADVTEAEMDEQFQAATFSLLPFPYATGAKLKLLKSLAYGVPVLCTASIDAQARLVVPPSLVADEPGTWADHVARVRAAGIGMADRERLLDIARARSWKASAARVLEAASTPRLSIP